MSYFDDASLVMIPSGYKTSKVYSVKPTDGSGDLTFSRSNDTATRVNSAGLIEKVRTNVITYSNTFSNAAWVKQQVGTGTTPVVTANYTTDPFGGNNAWRLQCNLNGGTTSGDRSWIYNSFGALSQSTISIYVKLNTAGTKDVVFSDSGGSVTTLTSTDWVRISITATGAGGEFRFGLIGGSTSDTLDCSIAFAQAESGDIATSYIATTSAAVSVGPVANVPRLDYLNSSCPRLLLEPQRVNLFQFSEQIDNAYWTKTNSTITANSVTSPDGYTNADTLTASGIGSVTHVITRAITTTSGSVYAFSVFAKKGNTDFIALRHDSGGTFNYFNINTGTKGATCDASATIENYGNGWYRCTVFHTATGSNGGEIYLATANGVVSFAAAGQFAYIYGAQYELGAYATSYIPTLGAAVTRGADAASKTDISSLIGQTEGTVFVEFKRVPKGVNYQAVVSLQGASSAYLIEMYFGASNTLLAAVYNSGAQFQSGTSALTEGTYKAALAYKENDFAFYVNGVQISTDNSGTVPALSTYNLGDFTYSAGFPQADGINQALLFKTRLSNSELAALTTL